MSGLSTGKPRALRVATGITDPADRVTVLTLGPHHPSSHGPLQLALTVDGGTVVTAEPRVGLLHRGAEKLFEVRDYRLVTQLASRHDWLSGFANEVGACLVAEQMLGVTPPPRATWLRTALCELVRVAHHLAFLGPALAGPAAVAPLADAALGRAEVLALVSAGSGARLHLALSVVGGLSRDVDPDWPDAVRAALPGLRRRVAAVATAAGGREAQARLRGVGVLPTAVVDPYGLSGPLARAAGVDRDLRRDEPYLAYRDIAPVRVVTRRSGDALARLEVLVEQCEVSLDLVGSCLAQLPGGEVSLRLPAVLRLPSGSCYSLTENPLGLMGYHLVSRGAPHPWRLHLRTPSFAAVQVLSAVLPGTALADLESVLATLLFVVGDVDK